MTPAQIRKELRRSACEDVDPWADVRMQAFMAAEDWLTYGWELQDDMLICDLRTFYLLVAEAM